MRRQRYSFWVKSDAPVGDEVGDVNATDADCCQFGLIRFTFFAGGDDRFAIDPNTVGRREF